MSYFPGMLRIIICSAVLIAVIAALKWGLNGAFDNLGYWPGIAICVAVGCAGLIGAYLYDRANTRSQEVLPPGQRDSR
ncbi:hypothetical protein M2222_008302 [Bradyrhizobium elkanii]|nr:hypothetical protein [Bradyrhizobium elkanii]MCS3565980.1 hypothetical protein [Bradyrhizobium elkanii]MCW2153290.1 hypothetical protein [Bradyrhizobium elkanii]MCW2377023.1 hypothetical protein [Bradyrhizobium elkanii]